MTLIEFPGMTSPISTLLLLLFILMIWALWEGLLWLAGLTFLGAMAVFLGGLGNADWGGLVGSAIAIALVTLGLWMTAFMKAKALKGGD